MEVLLVVAAVYAVVGVHTARRYWQRRHGLRLPLFGYRDDFSPGSIFCLAMVWPVLLLIPKFRAPSLCECRDHVMERSRI